MLKIAPSSDAVALPAPDASRPRRDLRLFLVGQSASVFGSSLTGSAVALVAVTELGATASDVSLLLAAGTIPALLFGPVAGVLMDRVDRPRRMLVAADLAAGVTVGACAVAAATGGLTLGWLVVLSVVLKMVSLVVEGLYFAHLNALGVADVREARGTLQSSEMLSRAAAGALGGPVVAAVGSALLFTVDVVTYLGSALCLLLLRAEDTRAPRTRERAALRTEFAAGVRATRANPVLRGYLVYVALGVLAATGVASQRAVFLLDTLSLPVALYTLPSVAATLAGAGGAMLAPRILRGGPAPRTVILWAVPGAAVATAALPLAGGGTTLVLTAMIVSTAVPLALGSLVNIALVGIIDDEIGEEFFGRVTALLGVVATAAATLGALLGGVLGSALGVRLGIWSCVGIDVLGAVLLVLILRRPAAEPEVQR